jgi:rhamnose utilization protein RhaD (predicted bifunctional aldolase and dehydrogenase)
MSLELIDSVVTLSRALGEPGRDWAILAEGNVSALVTAETMVVKASGARMATAQAEDYVEVRLEDILSLLDDPTADDASVETALMNSRIQPGGRPPSIEVLLHAVCLRDAGAVVVGHTHPTAVNSILCSDRAEAIVGGGLFPDQIVVLGSHQLFIPYADPGLNLARRVRSGLSAFRVKHSQSPKVIYLVNHGLFALGRSADEVMQITEMATKSARILAGALAIGNPVYLSSENASRIDTRPDELKRRERLMNSYH